MDFLMDVFDPVFPLQVRAARSLLGWTQKELADQAGVSELFVNRLERGERIVNVKKLGAIRGVMIEAEVRFLSSPAQVGVSVEGQRASVLRLTWEAKQRESE